MNLSNIREVFLWAGITRRAYCFVEATLLSLYVVEFFSRSIVTRRTGWPPKGDHLRKHRPNRLQAAGNRFYAEPFHC